MVFYYSRSGKTKIFAEALGEVTGREVYGLESELDKKGDFRFIFKALGMAFSGKSCPITNMPDTVPEEIFLCTPVWGGRVAGPPKFFLENIKNTTVNLLLTANVPVEKYKNTALELLNKMPCTAGKVYIFATSDKVPPEPETIKEQLREIL